MVLAEEMMPCQKVPFMRVSSWEGHRGGDPPALIPQNSRAGHTGTAATHPACARYRVMTQIAGAAASAQAVCIVVTLTAHATTLLPSTPMLSIFLPKTPPAEENG